VIILGINAYHGDASAALLIDGNLVAAAEEERFNRIKHSAGFPTQAVRYCLQTAGIKPTEIDYIAIAKDPRARWFHKALYAARMPRLALDRFAAIKKFASLKEELASTFDIDAKSFKAAFRRVEHHKAHLASSFFVSPFDEAAVLSVDGLGDFASTMWGIGRGNQIQVDGAIVFPHSLGIFYTALTQYLGFLKYGDEYKVMGLAAYGEPAYADEFVRLVQSSQSFGFSLGLDYFQHHTNGTDMTWRYGEPNIGRLYSDYLVQRLGPARRVEEPVDKRHADLASSLQKRLEEIQLNQINQLHTIHSTDNLCLAGGVAFNCVANGQILARTPFKSVYIQVAAGDAGLAIGAAFYVWNQVLGQPRSFVMEHAYWGPEFGEGAVRQTLGASSEGLEKSGCTVRRVENEEVLCQQTAALIAEGKVVGWFQGRMEWGPRSLGNRSILVDPRRPEMKDILNSRIKRREPFRPFAPSILEEKVGEYFEETHVSPFMLMSYKVRAEKRSLIPAPTHIDGSGRLQTVSRSQNPVYWRLIHEFEKLTGVPVLLNTSFNENEPIVCTPEEALDCFLRTKMDVLALGSYVVEKPLL